MPGLAREVTVHQDYYREGDEQMSGYIDSRLRPGERIIYQTQFSRLMLLMTGIASLIIFPLTAYFLMQLLAAVGGMARLPGSTFNGLLICLVTIYFIYKNLFDWFHATLAVTDQRIIGRTPRLLLAFSLQPVDLSLAEIREVCHSSGFISTLGDYSMVVVVDQGSRKIKIRGMAAPGELAARISQAASLPAAATSAPEPGPGPSPAAGPVAAPPPGPSPTEPAAPSPGEPLAPPPKGPQAPGVADQALARRTDWKPLAVLAVLIVVIIGLALWFFLPSGKPGKEIAKAPATKTPTTITPKPPAPAPGPQEPKPSTIIPDQARRPAPAPPAPSPTPPPSPKPPSKADDFVKLALQEKDLLKKIELYSKAIELDRYHFVAYCNRGNAYFHRKELDKALQDFNEALQLKPGFAEAYNGRANIHYERKENDEALADYTKAIALKPNFAVAYVNRGNVYFRKTDYDRALADYDKALELNPKYATAYAQRGNALFQKKDYDQALQAYEQAITLDPNHAWALYRCAVIYLQKGDSDKARQHYHKAKSLNPQLPELAVR